MASVPVEPLKGWIFALSDTPDSAWGDVDDFFHEIDASAEGDPPVLSSEVWGKVLRKGMQLEPGDGIAFYHTTRASFPRPDPYQRRARISLIGRILAVGQEGQHVNALVVELDRADLDWMRHHPVVRTEDTEDLFRASGMVNGAVASFYEIPRLAWQRIEQLARPQRVTEDSGMPVATSVSAVPERRSVTVTRVIRDTRRSRALKERYQHRCQVCGERLNLSPGIFYSEVHHLRPLGGKHRGPDSDDNMLVLCPNHHAAFDFGVPIFESASVIRIGDRRFELALFHTIAPDHVRYHNEEIVR